MNGAAQSEAGEDLADGVDFNKQTQASVSPSLTGDAGKENQSVKCVLSSTSHTVDKYLSSNSKMEHIGHSIINPQLYLNCTECIMLECLCRLKWNRSLFMSIQSSIMVF